MSKKTHQKELARARAKREAAMSVQRKQKRTRAVAILVVAAMMASVIVGVAVSLSGGDGTPEVAGFDSSQTDGFDDQETGEPDTTQPDPVTAPGATCPTGTDVPAPAGQQYDAPPEMQIDTAKTYTATMVTECGTIEIELFAADAPITVNNFVFLARDGYYDGVPFHRILQNFMIQGGDPTGSGSGGPGYSFEDELDTVEKYGFPRGVLAMANAGPATNGSQFFIVQGEASHLTTHTVFGRVTSGMDVVDDIVDEPANGGIAVEPVRIISITITEA